MRLLRRDCSRRSLICRDTGRAEMIILGSLYYTLRVKTDLWINETITKKLKELMRDCTRSMERATPCSTPRIKFDNDEVNNLLRPKRVPSVSTPKRVGGGTTIHQKFLPPQDGKQLHGGNLYHGMIDIFHGCKVFSLARTGDSFVSDGTCTQDTKRARNVTCPHT